MSNGPSPSVRCLLSALSKQQIGTKVRFLGCVTSYSTQRAEVSLRHDYPAAAEGVEAIVDVKLLLETLKSHETDIGQWVHVIGYTTFVKAGVVVDAQDPSRRKTAPRVGVQALTLWVAQDLDLGKYETTLSEDSNS
ncbi:CST complex subunit Ten1 [Xylariaceae sp. FL0594]|nr:CST complex subunit Ten1 [Xylariaceae sp. FL0594]